MKTLRLIFFFLLAQRLLAVDWVPPAINQGVWTSTSVGVSGGMLQFIAGGANDRAVSGTVRNVVTLGADNTGTNNVSTIVQNAIDASAPGDVVYFPAGTYRFTSLIFIEPNDSGVTIRGAGPASTTFIIATGTNVKGFSFAEGPFMPTISGAGQVVSGTKTKGTTTFTVPSSAGFTVGQFCYIYVENEENNTRIQAGAAPTWNSVGYPNLRRVFTKVTAVGAGTVTVATPLPWDCTVYTTTLDPIVYAKVTGVGFEDFTLSFVSAAHAASGIEIYSAEGCWAYNVHSTDWTKNTSSGQVINMVQTLNCEIRKCRGIVASPSTSGDDGFIQIYDSTSALLVDNIMSGWDNGIYEFGRTYHSVFAYNYIDVADKGIIHHNAHTSLVLAEGNCMTNFQSDGYHGSASNNSYYRNWLNGLALGSNSFMVALNRFVRYAVIAGNITGENGRITGQYSLGNPNIGNSAFTGSAQPTAGDFWADWAMTGTLTTRTSATTGVVTVSGGDFTATTGGGVSILYMWSSGTLLSASIVSRVGLAITIDTGGSTLPAAGTNFTLIRNGPAGFQEQDQDVGGTTTFVENYEANGSGTGSISNGTSDVLPNSLVYASKPTWFGNLAWPAYEPNSPVFNKARIPAGYRFVNGVDPPPEGPDTTVPTLTTASIVTTGNQLSLSFSEPMRIGSAGSSGVVLTMSGGATTLSFSSVSGSTVTYLITNRVIAPGETGTVAYTQPSNGIEDLAGNDLATLSGFTVTNNVPADTTAPTPNPMTFASAPSAISSSVVTMTGTTATDATSPPVQYYFDETSGNLGGTDSGWQSSTTYSDSGLSPNTLYTYSVKARDNVANETALSAPASVTTPTSGGSGTIQTLSVQDLRVGQ